MKENRSNCANGGQLIPIRNKLTYQKKNEEEDKKISSKFSSRNTRQNSDRRTSFFGRLFPSIVQPIYQGTYRMVPKVPFNIEQVNELLKNITNSAIRNNQFMKDYLPQRANNFVQDLSIELNMTIRTLKFDRFRIVVIVNLIEKAQQSYISKMAFLIDKDNDRWTSHKYECNSYILHVLAFGVYWE